jgi:hypothetical protein
MGPSAFRSSDAAAWCDVAVAWNRHAAHACPPTTAHRTVGTPPLPSCQPHALMFLCCPHCIHGHATHPHVIPLSLCPQIGCHLPGLPCTSDHRTSKCPPCSRPNARPRRRCSTAIGQDSPGPHSSFLPALRIQPSGTSAMHWPTIRRCLHGKPRTLHWSSRPFCPGATSCMP